MRKFWNFVPFQLTVFLILGILFGSYFQIEVNFILIIVSILIVLFFIIYYFSNKLFETNIWFSVIVYLLTFFVGISSFTFQNNENKSLYYANQQNFSTVELQTAYLSIKKTLKPNTYNDKYEAEVIQLNAKKSLGKILVNIKKDSLTLPFNVDDQLFVNTLFTEIPSPKNPYEFSYKNYLKNQQIHHQIYIDNSQKLYLGKSNPTLKGLAATIRENINFGLKENGFKNDELAVINALLLGQRNYISTELRQSYTGAGAIHILAVSGLHVGIILLILTFIFKPLHYFKHGKLIASICVILLLWIFAIIAGLSASVVYIEYVTISFSLYLHIKRFNRVLCLEYIVELVKKKKMAKIEVSMTKNNWESKLLTHSNFHLKYIKMKVSQELHELRIDQHFQEC